ncbi:MAG: class I adenylate-forming enzyme family protein [Lysobacterales bacterium]
MLTSSKQRIDEMTQHGWWGEDRLDDLFLRAVSGSPQRTALVDPPDRSTLTDGSPMRWTFSDLAVLADNLAADLYARGLREDDIVVVQLPNIAELAILYLALGKLGVILSPVPMQYGPFELSKASELLNPKAYISVSRFKGEAFAEAHGSSFASDCTMLCFGNAVPADMGALRLDNDTQRDNAAATQYQQTLELSANDIFTICWTSGTTGLPKGVPRSHNMWMASAIGAHDAALMRDHEILLNPFPLVNMAAIGGFLYCWLMRECTLVLHHPFNMQVFLQQIQSEQVAYTIAPPAVLTMLLNRRDILSSVDISSLRAVGSGSAPLSEFMVAGFGKEFGIDILNIFGSNEGICLASGPQDVSNYADRAHYFPRFGVEGLEWSNRAATSTRTRLVALDGGEEIREPGTPGELEIWGATLFDGYFKSADTNAEVFTDDGYFRTGDVFQIAGDGDQSELYEFIGRCKDIIVRGGVNISPAEIDNELTAHPKLADVCVVGIDDPVLGERIGVAVVPKPEQSVDLDDITAFLRERGMAIFKLPEQLVCVDALPYNATGKLQRRDVQRFFQSD